MLKDCNLKTISSVLLLTRPDHSLFVKILQKYCKKIAIFKPISSVSLLTLSG